MAFVLTHPYISMGAFAVAQGVTPQSAAIPNWDTTQRFPLGTVVQAREDIAGGGNNPTNAWGGAEFMYCKWSTASTLTAWSVVGWDINYNLTATPSTANLGGPVAVLAFAALPSASATVPAFCWVQRSGVMPVVATATVAAAAAVGVGTSAGTATGTIVAGKEIIGCKGGAASAGTITKANVATTNGSTILVCPNTDGLYVGAALSGTGIAASVINTILPDGHTIVASVAATATGIVTMTQTNTGFIIVVADRMTLTNLT